MLKLYPFPMGQFIPLGILIPIHLAYRFKVHLLELKTHHSLASYPGRSLLDHLFVGAGLSCHGTMHVSNIIHRDSFAAACWGVAIDLCASVARETTLVLNQAC